MASSAKRSSGTILIFGKVPGAEKRLDLPLATVIDEVLAQPQCPGIRQRRAQLHAHLPEGLFNGGRVSGVEAYSLVLPIGLRRLAENPDNIVATRQRLSALPKLGH